jgi:hypothetical protein
MMADVLLYLTAAAIWLSPSVVAWLKGKRVMAVVGLLLWWPVMVAIMAIRLAKPDSWWYRHRYDDDKRRRSFERFGGTGANPLAQREAGVARPSLEA